MGREIRRVPPDWEHPRNSSGDYIPLHDNDYNSEAQQWEADYDLWRKGEHPDQLKGYGKSCRYFWEYDSPPGEESYRQRAWTPEEATAYQIYETVSEGTPKSPVFLTTDAMHDWLLAQGYSEAAASGFIASGWVPSGMAIVNEKGATFYSDIESAGIPKSG